MAFLSSSIKKWERHGVSPRWWTRASHFREQRLLIVPATLLVRAADPGDELQKP